MNAVLVTIAGAFSAMSYANRLVGMQLLSVSAVSWTRNLKGFGDGRVDAAIEVLCAQPQAEASRFMIEASRQLTAAICRGGSLLGVKVS